MFLHNTNRSLCYYRANSVITVSVYIHCSCNRKIKIISAINCLNWVDTVNERASIFHVMLNVGIKYYNSFIMLVDPVASNFSDSTRVRLRNLTRNQMKIKIPPVDGSSSLSYVAAIPDFQTSLECNKSKHLN